MPQHRAPPPDTLCDSEHGASSSLAGGTAEGLGPGFGWVLLQRHGRRPLAVLARCLLRADNCCAGLACWSEIALYETAGCRFVVAVAHVAPAGCGPTWRDAWLCDDPDAVRAALRAHDPLRALPPELSCAALAMPLPANQVPPQAWHDPAAAWRLRLAWAGLLWAVFGSASGGPAAPAAASTEPR